MPPRSPHFQHVLTARDQSHCTAALVELFVVHKDASKRALMRGVAHAICDVRWADDLGRFFRQTPPESVGDGWFLCPTCADAVEAADGVWRCSCGAAIGQRALHIDCGDDRMLVFAEALEQTAGLRGRFSYLRIQNQESWLSWTDEGKHFRQDGEPRLGIFEAIERLIAPSSVEVERIDLADLDRAAFWERFAVVKAEAGYLTSGALVCAMEDGAIAVEQLSIVVEHLRRGFSFIPGGDWVPRWMPDADSRRRGSPYAIVRAALGAAAVSDRLGFAVALLPYVLCDQDVLHHDALAGSAELGMELIGELATAEEPAIRAQSAEETTFAFERCAKTLAGFSYGDNLFPLATKLLALDYAQLQQQRIAEALLGWTCDRDDDVNWLSEYLATDVLDEDALDLAAQTLGKLKNETTSPAIAAVLARNEQAK